MGEQGKVEGAQGVAAVIRPTIRLAQDHEGEEVHAILAAVGQVPGGLDWSRVYPSWLVAEHDGIIVGVIQVIMGYPLSHIGFWAVEPAWQNKGVGILLWWEAEKMIGDSGSDSFTGMTTNPQVLKRLPEVGGILFGDEPAKVIFKRVSRKRKEVKHGHQNHILDEG